MRNDNNKSRVVDVFIDVDAHRFTADIIKRHSTNRDDIRKVALDGLNVKWCKNILELGCGFGFFTEALKGKVHPDAVVTGVDIIRDYEPLFLEACKRAGIKGDFTSSGASVVKDLKDRSVDLVICSYSLYFFPEIVPDISRILKSDGLLVATVHNRKNMNELVSFARDVLASNGMLNQDERLPIEIFISSFSSENGHEILSPWFQDIQVTNYSNTLVFKPGDIYSLIEYFRFKCPFLLSRVKDKVETVFDLLEVHLQKSFTESRSNFTISKDDTIFVCSNPLLGKGAQ